jgi:hypothetical protein
MCASLRLGVDAFVFTFVAAAPRGEYDAQRGSGLLHDASVRD